MERRQELRRATSTYCLHRDKVLHMKHLRHYKRFWLLLLALIAGSLQMQTVYACSEMAGQLQSACCCEEPDDLPCGKADSCGTDHLSARACCEVSYSASFDEATLFFSSAQTGKSGAAHALPPPDPLSLESGTSAFIGKAAPTFGGGPGTSIYLTTRRLRI